ncbi:MAG: Crp/Fnr family transcriptional regulator [Sporomusaceae bacterium]|nr:Crp/Fnr family transcriptional regulator [Sporomusaceae bacterium]
MLTSNLKCCRLFAGMSDAEIEQSLQSCQARIMPYPKNSLIFQQSDTPRLIHILLSGAVAICKDSLAGKRTIVTTISQCGEMFGEVYVFLEKKAYDYYAVATENASVLELPQQAFAPGDGQAKLVHNMLFLLAEKAYFLNQKLQIMSADSLRQKLAKLLLENADSSGLVRLTLNREELADYLRVARPSLSRELMKMRQEGLLTVANRQIRISDRAGLQECL